MALHATLRELVDTYGEDVLADPQLFRGVLDDFLEEDAATAGEINLLVDAVRFGSLPSLISMIDSGAEVQSALGEAGARLARERGGADHLAGGWATAMLGYAVGRVPEASLAGFPAPQTDSALRPATTSPPPVPPTFAPPQQTIAPPRHRAAPPQQAGATFAPANAPSWPPPGPLAPGSVAPAPTAPVAPRRRRPVALIAAVAAVVVLLLVGAVVAVVVLREDDDPPVASDDPSETEGQQGSGEESPPADVSLPAVSDRYASVAVDATRGSTSCAAVTPATGQTEALDCELPVGTLHLVTFETPEALRAARQTVVDGRVGTIRQVDTESAYYSFDPASSGTDEPALVYWDDLSGLQAATLTGNAAADAGAVGVAFDATQQSVARPTVPADEELVELLGLLEAIDLDSCERIPSYETGSLEESQCTVRGGRVAYVGKMRSLAGLRGLRLEATQEQQADDAYPPDDLIFDDQDADGVQDPGEETLGVVRGYRVESETAQSAVLYFDHNECVCYIELWEIATDGSTPDPEKLDEVLFG